MRTSPRPADPEPSLEVSRADILEHLPPQAAETYAMTRDWLVAKGVAGAALKVGDTAPDFLLPDAQGRLVSSRELRERGPLVVSFFRGGWCPFCAAELAALQAAEPALGAAGASLVAITPDNGGVVRELARRLDLSLTLLSDVDYGVGLAFGVIYVLPEPVRRLYKATDVDLPRRHGAVEWVLPIPATFVVDERSVIRDAYVEPDATKRREPAALVRRLDAMAAERRAPRPQTARVAPPRRPSFL